jgi:predicted XRE-type DNA-binding protein
MSKTPAGRLLNKWLDDREIYQCELSRQTGVVQSTISAVIRGRRPHFGASAAKRIAAYTGLPVEKLANPRSVIVVKMSTSPVQEGL